jgi:general secretion pathway protein G
LIVIAIIAILATMLLAGANSAKEAAKKKKALAEITAIEAGLVNYKQDYRVYPKTGSSTYYSGDEVLKYLMKDLTGAQTPRNYATFKTDNISGLKLNDPWGNPYEVDCAGTQNTGSIDIYSKGKDGTGNGTGEDDVNNWDRQ